MTGGKNILKYINTEGKRTGKLTALEYLQKNTGVFNKDGQIEQEQVEAMKKRAAKNQGNIWHGFVSLNEEESHKIDTPEKCINLVKRTFGKFFKDAHLNEQNLDLMCALHLDRPHHLHIHFVFWEKEPRYRNNGIFSYRSKGKIDQTAIDNMFVSLGLAIDERKSNLYESRDAAIGKFKAATSFKSILTGEEEIKKAVLSLAKDLPKTGRLSYGSKDMEGYRERTDKIVQMLLENDEGARKADRRFYSALAEREAVIKNICGTLRVDSKEGSSSAGKGTLPPTFAFSDKNVSPKSLEENLPKYNYKIDVSKINLIAEIEADYKRRQGNLVLGLAKAIKPEIFERKQNKGFQPKRYKTNDNTLKRNLSISRRKIDGLFKKFVRSFGNENKALEREHTNRLREIENEMLREKEQEYYSQGHNAQKFKKEDEDKNWTEKQR